MSNNPQYRCLMILTNMDMGGVATSAVNFCSGLCERGVQVDILLMSDHNDVESYGLPEKVNIFYLKGFSKMWNLNLKTIKSEKNIFKKTVYLILAGFKYLANTKKLWTRIVFRNKKLFSGYDIAIAYRQCQPCCHLALHNVEAKKKIAFIHADLVSLGDISAWQPLLYDFDAVAYVSKAVKDAFISKYPKLEKNAVTVYNTFLSDEIINKSKIKCDLQFDKNKINLITVSRIENTKKGTGRIAPVCKLLKEKYPNKFHWYVIGDGPDFVKCKQQSEALGVSDHLTYLGMHINPFNFWSQADICVFPTLTESFGMVAVESLILGVPVVATRYPAITEIIDEKAIGLIAEQNEFSLFEKVSELLEDKQLLQEMKSNCMQYKYDNERSYKQFFDAVNL